MKRECPICSSDSNSLVDLDILTYDDSPFGNKIRVGECVCCKFVFSNFLCFTESEIENYYENLSKYSDSKISTGGGQTPSDIKRLKQTAIYLDKKLNNKNLRILDVGCSNGGLLYQLYKLGYENIVGVDPSNSCVNNTQAIGVRCFKGSVRNLSEVLNLEGKFDLIIYSHVFEHLVYPLQTLEEQKKLLNPDGLVYIECPDSSKYHINIHSPFQEFNTEHINHFSIDSMANLARNCGMRVDDSGERILELNTGEYYACYSLLRYCSRSGDLNQKMIEVNNSPIYKYIEESNAQLRNIESYINQKIRKNAFLGLYGIGQLAFKLLALRLNKKYDLLYDGSLINQERSIGGTRISPPKSLAEVGNIDLIISSKISANQILEDIKSSLNNTEHINFITL